MKAVQSNEAFKRIDGCMRFSYVNYYVQQDGALYRGKWKDRHQTPQTLDQLDEIQQIQTEDRGPVIDSTWSLTHVNKPSLESYLNPDLEGQLRREITVCELLRQHQHPNIAAYYGCQETRGRVSGLCLKRYRTMLLEKYMPQSLNKGDFPSTRDGVVDVNTARAYLEDILTGIQHLHKLGLVHNDINPANIMLDEDGTVILIDFDSCRRVGEPLGETHTKRTHQWHDPRVDIALENNDLDAWEELKTWFTGCADEYLFK